MELMQLEMFVAVVEERTVRKAAERVFRTQPAVSLALGKLEREIGTRLFERESRKHRRLSHSGEVLYEFASELLGRRNQVLSVLRREDQVCSGRLSVGVDNATSQYVQSVTNFFSLQYPNVRVEWTQDRAVMLLEELQNRTTDVAFLADLPEACKATGNLNAIPIRSCGRTRRRVWLVERSCGRSYLSKVFVEFAKTTPAIARGNAEH